MPGPFDEFEKEAEILENRSIEEFKKKNFISAISLLEEAKELYLKLGFHGKIGMITKRIFQLKNLVKFEKQDTLVKTKGEMDFQRRTEKVIKEKQRFNDKTLEQQKVLPPEMKNKLEKIHLLVEKAEKEEMLGKYPRVIGRYEYLLELYKSIPKEIANFAEEIYEIEKKLAMIRKKL